MAFKFNVTRLHCLNQNSDLFELRLAQAKTIFQNTELVFYVLKNISHHGKTLINEV